MPTGEFGRDHHELLTRLDERSLAMANDIAEVKRDVSQLKEQRESSIGREEFDRREAAMRREFWEALADTRKQSVEAVSEHRKEIGNRLAEKVSKTAFWPVKMIVYTGAGTVLLAVLGAVVALVIIRK